MTDTKPPKGMGPVYKGNSFAVWDPKSRQYLRARDGRALMTDSVQGSSRLHEWREDIGRKFVLPDPELKAVLVRKKAEYVSVFLRGGNPVCGPCPPSGQLYFDEIVYKVEHLRCGHIVLSHVKGPGCPLVRDVSTATYASKPPKWVWAHWPKSCSKITVRRSGVIEKTFEGPSNHEDALAVYLKTGRYLGKLIWARKDDAVPPPPPPPETTPAPNPEKKTSSDYAQHDKNWRNRWDAEARQWLAPQSFQVEDPKATEAQRKRGRQARAAELAEKLVDECDE